MRTAGVAINSGGIRVAVFQGGRAEPVRVDGAEELLPETAWDGVLATDAPAARGWVGCLGSPTPLAVVDGHSLTARDGWVRVLQRVRAALEAVFPGVASEPLGLAVPFVQAAQVRPRNDHLAAAREAGFANPFVVPSAIAIACHAAADPKAGQPVLVLNAEAEGLELVILVPAGGKWTLATAPERLPGLGRQAWIRSLIHRVLAEYPPESSQSSQREAVRVGMAVLERTLATAVIQAAETGLTAVSIPYPVVPTAQPGSPTFPVTADLLRELVDAEITGLRTALEAGLFRDQDRPFRPGSGVRCRRLVPDSVRYRTRSGSGSAARSKVGPKRAGRVPSERPAGRWPRTPLQSSGNRRPCGLCRSPRRRFLDCRSAVRRRSS